MDNEMNQMLQEITKILPLILPVLLIQWGLMIYSLLKLLKSSAEPKLLPKWGWLLVIVFVNLIGPILYLVAGRRDE